MKNNIIIVAVITAVITGGAGFFGGMKYQQSQAAAGRFSNFAGGAGGSAARLGRGTGTAANGARPVNGDIISSDDKSVTVKLADGSSRIVLFSGSTTLNKATAASPADLKTGERIAAFGTQNPDGSMTATNIQINPTSFNGAGGGRPDGSPNPNPAQ